MTGRVGARLRAVHLDFGSGDGAFARWTATHNPETGVIGVDASADGLREASRRALAKPARGGLSNLVFGRLSLAEAPATLAGLADELTVLLPWGSLLAAVARPGAGGLAALRALGKPGAGLRIVFGYGAGAEAGAIADLRSAADRRCRLPPPGSRLPAGGPGGARAPPVARRGPGVADDLGEAARVVRLRAPVRRAQGGHIVAWNWPLTVLSPLVVMFSPPVIVVAVMLSTTRRPLVAKSFMVRLTS